MKEKNSFNIKNSIYVSSTNEKLKLNLRKKIINNYITTEYIENIDTIINELIEENIKSFIKENKIILPIISWDKIFHDIPYDSYVIDILINLVLYNIKKYL